MGRGRSKAGKGGGGSAKSQPSFNDFSEYYQNRLRQIDSEIRQKQMVASLYNPSNSAYVNKKAKNAMRSIERLDKKYSELEKSAIKDAKLRRSF